MKRSEDPVHYPDVLPSLFCQQGLGGQQHIHNFEPSGQF